jgi:hypothetical protein
MSILPKDRAIRQRTNRSTSRAILPAENHPRLRAPSLPDHPEGEKWHKMTCQFWRDLWASPMRFEILRVDEHALFILLVLIDKFWNEPSLRLAAEIRVQKQAFGLTPIDRRRLEWTVAQAEEAKDVHAHKQAGRAIILDDIDPGKILEG